MNTVRKIYESDDTGTVHLEVPIGAPHRRVEVVLVWDEVVAAESTTEMGWPPGWFEATAIEDPSFARANQGTLEQRDGLP